MPFLFKIIAILIGIFIWKAVIGSFRKANKAIHDDSDDEEDSASVAQNDIAARWRDVANHIFCTFDPGTSPDGKDISLTGKFSEHEITVKRFGRNYVRYFVAFKKKPDFHVCVVRDLESIAARILDGHPIFPSKMFFSSQEPDFFCSAESEEAFDRFLETPSNRSAVLNLVRLFPAGMFNNEGVSVRLRATVPDGEVILRMLAIAKALEEPSQTPMPDLLTAQKKGLLSVPKDFPPAVDTPEAETPKRFPPIQIAPAPATRVDGCPPPPDKTASDRSAEVIRIASGFRRSGQSDTPKTDLVRGASPARTSVPATAQAQPATAQIQPATAQTIPADDGLDIESVCSVLFGKAFPGAEERAAFDAMKGRRVRWSGELAMSLPFSMDFVFGSQKGVKATIHVCKCMQGSVPVQIKAVAAFPPELRETLDGMKGKTIVFGGELLKFEPFSREIYLQNASLEF